MHPAPHECGKGKSGEAVNLVSSEMWHTSSHHQLCAPYGYLGLNLNYQIWYTCW